MIRLMDVTCHLLFIVFKLSHKSLYFATKSRSLGFLWLKLIFYSQNPYLIHQANISNLSYKCFLSYLKEVFMEDYTVVKFCTV